MVVGCFQNKDNNTPRTHRTIMSPILFGFRPRDRKATKIGIVVDGIEYEPVEPSRFKVFSIATPSPLWSIVTSYLGLIVGILSAPFKSYIPLSSSGITIHPAKTPLPFRNPGLAVVVKKGVQLDDLDLATLARLDFASINFTGRTVWLKASAGKDDFLTVDKMAGVDPTGPSPNRYLNTHGFRSYLTLKSLTTRICQAFHLFTEAGGQFDFSAQRESSKLKAPWTQVDTATDDADMEDNAPRPTFEKLSIGQPAECDGIVRKLIEIASSGSQGLNATGSGVLTNSVSSEREGFIGLDDKIDTSGIVFKFQPRLALPDPNSIGDIIGRHFMLALGDSMEEQLENFNMLKSGLSSLRLTRVGDELSHLYKCIDIAIQSYAGCVPIFSNDVYEGCVLAGGPGATLIVNGEFVSFITPDRLNHDISTISEHTSTLSFISNKTTSEELQSEIVSSTTMRELRECCLKLETTQDIRDEIIRRAAYLNFGEESWVINPANLKSCFDIVADIAFIELTSAPIGRVALFSTDTVLLAMSCFGEKTAPSWDIPNGTKCSLKGNNPPTPPNINIRGKGSRGEINDAAWVMVVRTTDVATATEEFRRMADEFSYRSSSSALAKRVGHRVFSRDRMVEFWGPMREALRSVNPKVILTEGVHSLKRGATESSVGNAGSVDIPAGKRRMGF